MAVQNRHKEQKIEELEKALEAERKLRLQAENRLRRVHADFQEFTLNVSHDLREPLRTVSAYCELLARTKGGQPDPGADLFRGYILEAVERIQSLLAGMVEYAATEPDSRQVVSTDMNDVFQEAARRAAPQAGQRDASLTHDALPMVMGDFDGLVKVMWHLLANAIKFSNRSDPRAHASARREDAEWIFAVRDNGPGIDARDHQRVFGLFRRLHGREYPGHGLGLPFCKKVIEWHGGRIWVESIPGEGSTFYFTLPATD
jgi:light-regulated signal transduction histidine kinase (bacteriophytochrome)